MNRNYAPKKSLIYVIVAILCSLTFGLSMPNLTYADSDSDSSETGNDGEGDSGSTENPGGEEKPDPDDEFGDFNDDNRNDFTQDEGNNPGNLPGHITRPGSNNNSGNSATPVPTRPTANNNNESTRTSTPRSNSQDNSSENNPDAEDDGLTSDDRDAIDSTETANRADENSEASRDLEQDLDKKDKKTEPSVSENLDGLVWIFAGVILLIMILVGVVAFFVDKLSKKRNDDHEDLLGSVLDTDFKAEVEAIKKQDSRSISTTKAKNPGKKAESKSSAKSSKETSRKSKTAKQTTKKD